MEQFAFILEGKKRQCGGAGRSVGAVEESKGRRATQLQLPSSSFSLPPPPTTKQPVVTFLTALSPSPRKERCRVGSRDSSLALAASNAVAVAATAVLVALLTAESVAAVAASSCLAGRKVLPLDPHYFAEVI
jgi:hypothetical protein